MLPSWGVCSEGLCSFEETVRCWTKVEKHVNERVSRTRLLELYGPSSNEMQSFMNRESMSFELNSRMKKTDSFGVLKKSECALERIIVQFSPWSFL